MPQHWLLTESIVNMLFTLADGFGLHRFYDLCFLSWMFLFRVVSEAIDLQAGYAADITNHKAPRHSDVCIDGNGAIVVRLVRRVNRPQWSLWKKECMCSFAGESRCPVHRSAHHLCSLEPGVSLFAMTISQFLSQLNRLLSLTVVPSASSFSLKAFRPGKATAWRQKDTRTRRFWPLASGHRVQHSIY